MAEPLRREKEPITAELEESEEVDRRQREMRQDDVARPKPVNSEKLGPGELPARSGTGAQRRESIGMTPTPLFAEADIRDLRARWNDVQAGFVDEPRGAVEDADKLVATVMERLAQSFASEQSSLERQWSSGDEVSTEDLRVALQRYRDFFDRLLNA